jgi:hypothetical protein
MSEKSPVRARIAPLQKLTVRPIEDPVEQAALEAKLRQAEKTVSAPPVPDSPNAEPVIPRILSTCQRLAPEAQLLLVTELALQLPPAQRFDLVERLMATLRSQLQTAASP